ncbi:MAG: aminotransferase class I/II-fold pyridoxal phosphate-dependent enzyme [Clostridiales bacterium]|nr:aminotransferase class I/II-fold pyridoxal phosphate-dependent enzyme [Clostridiales bacterium]
MEHYLISKKENFLKDYSLHEKYKYDLSISGKMLAKYPRSLRFGGLLGKLDCYLDKDEEDKFLGVLEKRYSINKNNIILGPGANGILQNIIKMLFVGPKLNLVTPFYTFHQAVYGVNSLGCEVRYAKMEEDFNVSINHILKSVNDNTKMIFLCNPNNPTGLVIKPEEIIALAKSVKAYVVVSEASIEFSNTKSLLEYKLPSNIIVLRSFSKDFGLAGIRLGFAYASSSFKTQYLKHTPTNQVGNASLLIANYALKNQKTINKNISRVMTEVGYLQNALDALDIPYLKSKSNSIMICRNINKEILRVLEEQDFKVTTVIGENDELFIRIAVQSRKINKLFIKKLKQLKEVYNENFFSN